MSLINRALPSAAGTSGDVRQGRAIGSPLERSALLRLGNEAARRNNEAPPDPAR
jgi:hypothetical protein